MKEKGDLVHLGDTHSVNGIMYLSNKRTRLIVESINSQLLRFKECLSSLLANTTLQPRSTTTKVDGKTAFLNGKLKEEVYVVQPDGFVVLIIKKSLTAKEAYMDKQARELDFRSTNPHVFSDADHAGCFDTRKSTSGGIQF
ncbi:retrovirus-related pol polyprotein from transposon TNT 1-94 [Tanacetum coccineum]